MFKVHENGMLGLDYDQVQATYKYGIIFNDGRELILPQSIMRIVNAQIEKQEAVLRGQIH